MSEDEEPTAGPVEDGRPVEDGPGGMHSRRRFLQAAALAAPVAAVGAPAVVRQATASTDPHGGRYAAARARTLRRATGAFTHRGHRVRVTRDGQHLSLRIDGRLIPGAVQVRGDGVLASPDLLPYSDAEWGTDVRALVRRLIDGNHVDHVLF